MVVSGVVVDDAMDVQLDRHGPVDLPQERQELLMSMTWFATGKHRTVEHVQSGKQCGRAVAFVVVGDALGVAKAHGQHGPGALQRLALALLVNADHQRVVGRAQVQAHDITQLLDEGRVVGQLEAFAAMRLQAEELEVTLHAGLGDAGLGGHRAHAPVGRAVVGLGMQVVRIRCATRSSSMVRGLPGRTSSYSPGMRRSINRLLHLPTVALVTFSRSAIEVFGSPLALLRMICARPLSAAGSERLRSKD